MIALSGCKAYFDALAGKLDSIPSEQKPIWLHDAFFAVGINMFAVTVAFVTPRLIEFGRRTIGFIVAATQAEDAAAAAASNDEKKTKTA